MLTDVLTLAGDVDTHAVAAVNEQVRQIIIVIFVVCLSSLLCSVRMSLTLCVLCVCQSATRRELHALQAPLTALAERKRGEAQAVVLHAREELAKAEKEVAAQLAQQTKRR